MKFFFSAKWQRAEEVIDYARYAEELGHSVTSEWMYRVATKPYECYISESEAAAEKDIAGIIAADAIIHLSDGAGKSSVGEVCAGILRQRLVASPRVYIIGSTANESLFYFATGVERIVTDSVADSVRSLLVNLDRS